MKHLKFTITLFLLTSIIFLFCACGTVNFAKKYADIAGEYWVTIDLDGTFMKIDTNPYDLKKSSNSAALSQIKTVLKDLGFSAAVYEDMKGTTALMGRQSVSNKKYTVSWTYHPDKGLEVLFSKKQ